MTNVSRKTITFIFPQAERLSNLSSRLNSIISEFNVKSYNVILLVLIYAEGIDAQDTGEKEILIPLKLTWIQKKVFDYPNRPLASFFKALHHIVYREDIYRITNIHLALEKIPIDSIVVLSGPPFSLFTIISEIPSRPDLKLILDYRDPWTHGYIAVNLKRFSDLLRRFGRRGNELLALSKASLITTVSQTLKNQFPEKFHHKIHVNPNGANFEPALAEINPKPEIFTIFYAGTIYNDQIADETFFKALQLFIKGKDQQKIKLVFAGASKNKKLPKTLFKHELLEIAEILPRLENEEVKPYFANSSLFLHLRYGNRSGIITSKQADYLAWRKPILLPVSDNGDLAESITTHNAGYVCNGVAESLAVLEQLWQKFLNKEDIIIDQDEEFLRKNTRTYWAEEFVKLVEQL